MPQIEIKLLEKPSELNAVEVLQRIIWPGDETEIVPVHIFRAVIHNGGLVIGAFSGNKLVGFVFGFPGLTLQDDEFKPIHVSHMAGVHPEFRNSGVGFSLKRAQWQVVRKQGLNRITWTYDPLQSRNAKLNISKLGAVCDTYIPNYYGELRDEVNVGVPSDRFQVDWWVNTNRVKRRLHQPMQKKLALNHYLDAGTPFANQTSINKDGFPCPDIVVNPPDGSALLLLEIPGDMQAIKLHDMDLAIRWSSHIREHFQKLFQQGYIVTDYVFQQGQRPRGFYVLTNGDATLLLP